jgi:hypothetical protein
LDPEVKVLLNPSFPLNDEFTAFNNPRSCYEPRIKRNLASNLATALGLGRLNYLIRGSIEKGWIIEQRK